MATLRSGTKLGPAGSSDDSSTNGTSATQNGGGSDPKEKENARTRKVVFGSLILDLLGFTVVLPLFPALLEYYHQNDSSGLYASLLASVTSFQHLIGVPARFHSVLFGGLLGSLFSLLQFLFSPLTGALSDVYGRKPIFLITLVGVAASYGLWAAASNFALFVLARIIGGAAKGNVSLAYSIMTDVSDERTRARGMALIGVAFSIGFTIGPTVGAAFSKWGSSGWFAASALYALALALANIAFFAAFFRETLPLNKRRRSIGASLSEAWELINPRALFSFSSVKGLSKEERSKLVQLGRVYFLYLFLYSGLEFTLTFVTHHKHSYDSLAQGRMFSFLGLVMAVTQGGFMRSLRSGSEKTMANRGLMMMVPAFILIGASETNIGLYFGLTLYAIGSSLMVPCLTAMASIHGAASHKGTLLGIWRSLGALARAFGPIVTSIGFWWLGAEVCYIIGGLSMLAPLIMLQAY
ncbi:major facilitator superfamily domain-containing protein 10-like isoform X2 [Eriocheir sinensis]|nr:major facilitator superfamily domain-containing protein 10-like isoform X2 [Eriocheir sinensis]XP_050694096.1 major facilitator superfamily domain-containing protein 10-like isoform X2 [Eriocheir sinensis]XP_050694097.1 major facilitator superfamily domain-containing protein 10-like isoform X2 [Eriocheir sinensis]